jgi:hypothetical protein
MEETQKRLGILDSTLADVRADVSAIKATLSHLATRAELKEAVGRLEALISARDSRLIQWIVGTAIALTGVAFIIARYVH